MKKKLKSFQIWQNYGHEYVASLFGAPCIRRHRIRSVLRTKHVYGLQSGWNVIDEKRWQRRETKQHFTKWHHTSSFVADDCSWPMSHACSKCMMNITCLIVGGLCRPLLDRFAVIISTASRCRWCIVCDLVTARFVRWLCACLSVCLSVYMLVYLCVWQSEWLFAVPRCRQAVHPVQRHCAKLHIWRRAFQQCEWRCRGLHPSTACQRPTVGLVLSVFYTQWITVYTALKF